MRKIAIPPPAKYEYLLGVFYQIGPKIEFSEVVAWQTLMEVKLNNWEVLALRIMSNAFKNQTEISKAPEAPNPVLPADKQNAQRVQLKLEQKFNRL